MLNLEVVTKDVILPVLTLGISKLVEWRKARKAEEFAKAVEEAVRAKVEAGGVAAIRTRCLLLVEDDANDIELLRYYLRQATTANPEKYAVEVEVATNTDDAWTMYLQKNHDIVLVDMRFPTGDQGWVLAEKMRRHNIKTQIVIVYTVAEDVAKLPAGQIFSFMRKPPTYEGILQLLAKLK